MCPNPLMAPILGILRQTRDGMSEHQLIQALKAADAEFGESREDPDLALFRIHFLVMNALYRLQQEQGPEGMRVRISPLCIQLHPDVPGSAQELCEYAGEAAVRDYYLDFEQLIGTSSQQVRSLFDSFWQHYLAGDRRVDALSVLGLAPQAEWAQIQQAYRRRAFDAHPDRGGDTLAFMRVREAYEVLKHG